MYKDTAKWLLTFTPITAVITLALTLGPRIETVASAGLLNWVCEFPVATAAVVLTVIATVVIIILCSYVLLAEASPWTELRTNDTWWSEAFSKHVVGMPLFPSANDFETAETRASTDTASAAEHTALAATTSRIQALSESLNAKDRFKKFSWGYGACMIVILGGLAVAAFSLPAVPDPVTKPTAVSLNMPAGAANRFSEMTGCPKLDEVTAIAVGGLWSHPTLRLIGPGCPTTDWTPPDDLGVIVTPK